VGTNVMGVREGVMASIELGAKQGDCEKAFRDGSKEGSRVGLGLASRRAPWMRLGETNKSGHCFLQIR